MVALNGGGLQGNAVWVITRWWCCGNRLCWVLGCRNGDRGWRYSGGCFFCDFLGEQILEIWSVVDIVNWSDDFFARNVHLIRTVFLNG